MTACECGCGALIEKRFVKGHNTRGVLNYHWKEGRQNDRGYKRTYMPDHPRANHKGFVLEHILIAEKALGHSLPLDTEIHHANGSRDNGPLVICQDMAYHQLLHWRQRALSVCGHAGWKKCRDCGKHDDLENLRTNKSGYYYHTKEGKEKGLCLSN